MKCALQMLAPADWTLFTGHLSRHSAMLGALWLLCSASPGFWAAEPDDWLSKPLLLMLSTRRASFLPKKTAIIFQWSLLMRRKVIKVASIRAQGICNFWVICKKWSAWMLNFNMCKISSAWPLWEKGSPFWRLCPYRDLFEFLGPYSLFRVPIFIVWGKFTQRMSIQSAWIRLWGP